MSKPFDVTLKDLVQSFPADYAAAFRLEGGGPVAPLNVDLSTVTAATDVVLSRGDPFDALMDINFLSGWDGDTLARVLLYNALLYYRYRVPVHSVVVLLRPSANDLRLDQGLRYAVWEERGHTHLAFEVVRMWQQPVEPVLAGGLGTLPLAPLCQLPAGVTLEQALPDILRRIDERLGREATPEVAGRLWSATFVLTGLRLPREPLGQLFRGVRGMKESSGYQIILDEGRTEEAQKILLRQGQRRFGPPTEATRMALQGMTDLERLERMTDRIFDATTWEDLLNTP